MADLRLPGGDVVSIDGDERDGSVFLPIVHTGHYEPHVLGLLSSLVPDGGVVVDAGANIGVVTIAAARAAAGVRVVAFEASPHNAGFLRTNVEANVPGAVTVVEAALSDAPGTLHLRFDDTFQGGAHVADRPTNLDTAVPAVTLDGWVDEHGLDRLDLVKLDVEGAEVRFLAGARDTLRRLRPTMLVECNAIALRRAGSSAEILWRELSALYHHRYLLEDDGRLLAVHGWGHLLRRLRHKGTVDLVCTSTAQPGVDRTAGWRNAAGTWWRARRNRGRHPEVLLSAGYDLTPARATLELAAGATATVPVRIVNRTSQYMTNEWPRAAVNLSYQVVDPAGVLVSRDGPRTPIPLTGPGGSVEVPMAIEAPDEPGRYTLRLSLVQEAYAWGLELDPDLDATIDLTVT